MPGDTQEKWCGICSEIHKEDSPQQEPAEGDRPRDCRVKGVRVQWPRCKTPRGV